MHVTLASFSLTLRDSPAPLIEFSLGDASPYDREIYVLVTVVLSTALAVLACVFVRCAWLRQGNVRPVAEEVRAPAVGAEAAQLDKLVAREEDKDRKTYAEHADFEAIFPFFKDPTEELVSCSKAPTQTAPGRVSLPRTACPPQGLSQA